MGFNSSRQSQSSEPWSAQQPYLQNLFSRAEGYYQNRPSVAGTEGLEQSLFNRAQGEVQGGGSPVEQALGQFLGSSLVGRGGYNPYQGAVGEAAGASNPFAGAGNPIAGISNPYTQGILNAGGRSNPFAGALGGHVNRSNPYIGGIEAASGAANPFVGNILGAGGAENPYVSNVAQYGAENPWLDRTFDRASQSVSDRFTKDVIPGVNATFGSAGRTGGGLHGQVFADAAGKHGDTLNNLATDIYGGAYENDARRRLQRDVSTAQFGESALGRALQAATAASGFADAGLDRRLQGALGAAGFGASDLDRSLRAATTGADYAGQDLDRGLRAALGAGGFGAQDLDRAGQLYGRDLDRSTNTYRDDLNRALEGATSQAGFAGDDLYRNLQQRLGAAGLVGQYEGLQDRNVNNLASFANPEFRNLRDFQSLINPALIQSQGSGSSSGFSLK